MPPNIDIMPLSIPKKSNSIFKTAHNARSMGIIFNTPIVTLYRLFLLSLSAITV